MCGCNFCWPLTLNPFVTIFAFVYLLLGRSEAPVSHDNTAKSTRAFITNHTAIYQQPRQMTSIICCCRCIDFRLNASVRKRMSFHYQCCIISLLSIENLAVLNRWIKLEYLWLKHKARELCVPEHWEVWVTAALKDSPSMLAFSVCLSPCCCHKQTSIHVSYHCTDTPLAPPQ